MEFENNTQNWNENYQPQNPNPSEQPPASPATENQWLNQTWMNVKVTTWLKCLIVVAALAIAAVFIAPKFTSAESTKQNSTSFQGYSDFEDDWYGYED